MGTKSSPGSFDCYDRALPDEPMFVILGRDPTAPILVEAWARMRKTDIDTGERPQSDMAMVTEATKLASDMYRWREKNEGRWRTPPSPELIRARALVQAYRRLIRLDEPSREVDGILYRLFSQPEWKSPVTEEQKVAYCETMALSYTKSIDAALKLMPSGYTRAVCNEDLRRVRVSVYGGPLHAQIGEGVHAVEAIATCTAIVSAVMGVVTASRDAM